VSTSLASVPAAFSLLAKPTGAACNLACGYCFYLSKEQLYPGSRFRMPESVLEAYIQQLLASQPPGAELSLAWQGGEPTLIGREFFQRSILLAEKYKIPGQSVSYTLQTNGTRLDDAWCAFFKEHDFLIGLSLDGPPELHNAYRVDKAGQGTYDQVKRAWDLLQKHQVDTNILCALHAANASHPLEVYRFFRDDLGARFLQFIPIVERLRPVARLSADHAREARRSHSARKSPQVSARSVGSRQYGLFLVEVFDDWLCVFQETCGRAFVLEHNGDLYACDHFVEPGHCLGNILEQPLFELVDSPAQRRFGLEKRDRLPGYCRDCDVHFACQGECPRNRFIQAPGGEAGLNYLCAGYRLFFRHVDPPMRRMADLLRQGRSPAEIMLVHRETPG
jgi:uncharacterized protein